MTEGLVAVQARIAQLQALLGPRTTGAPLGSAATSRDGFADALAEAGGTSGTGGTGGTSSAPSAGTANPAGSAALGKSAVALAQQYFGVKYRWGGTNPATGLDCSGLVQLVYGKLGIQLPRTSQQQQHSGTKVPSLSQAQPGDLVFFGQPAHHVGIYVGDGKMIDAPRTGKTVGVHKLYGTPSHIRRLTGAASASLGGSGVGGVATPGTVSRGASSAVANGPYGDLFIAAGNRHGVDPALLSAVAKAESRYNPRAVSSAGAIGLMQLMPGTARSLGVDPTSPAQAVDGAARLLASHLRSYGGRVDWALAAYNAGPGAVKRYGGVPPYAETTTYVKRVTSYWKALR